jgi:hypothetical protein
MASGREPRHGTPAAAHVPRRAEVSIVAGRGVVRVRAACRPVAGVVGAHVLVVGTRCARRRGADVRRLVAGVVALGAGPRAGRPRAGRRRRRRWSAPVHPLPMYFAAVALLITIVGRFLYRRRRYDGQIAVLSLALFSLSTWSWRGSGRRFPARPTGGPSVSSCGWRSRYPSRVSRSWARAR